MACRSKILFPAIFRDGTLLNCTEEVLMDCAHVKIIGEKTDKAWDADKFGFECITGLFVSYGGIEYGSTEWVTDDFLAACEAACNPQPFRIHVNEFAIEFV